MSKIKKVVLIILIILILCFNINILSENAEARPPSFDVEYIYWNEDKVISDDVTINYYETLIVKPGTTIKFNNDVKLQIYGNLVAVGNDTDKITFKSNGNDKWDGIRINYDHDNWENFQYDKDYYSTETKIKNVIIENAKIGLKIESRPYPVGTLLQIPAFSSFIVKDCDIGLYFRSSEAPLLDTTFESNKIGLKCYFSDKRIDNCVFKNSEQLDIELLYSDVTITNTKVDINKISFDRRSTAKIDGVTYEYSPVGEVLFLISIMVVFLISIYFYYLTLNKKNIRKKDILERIGMISTGFFLIYGIILFIFLPLLINMYFWGFGLPFEIGAIILIIFITFWLLQDIKLKQTTGEISNKRYWESIFTPIINQEIRRKSMRFGKVLIVIYLIILFSILIPVIIIYNESWADGHSGARSPVGSGAECCGVFLIILFVLIYLGAITYMKHKYKNQFFQKYKELVNKGNDPINIFLEDEILQKYSIICPRCNTININYNPFIYYIICHNCKNKLNCTPKNVQVVK